MDVVNRTDKDDSIPSLEGDLREAIRKKARNSRRISWLLDECIRVPGTQIRFGIDPLLGLIPYGGETAATLVGTMILGEAGKRGIPIKTLARMGGNMVMNAGFGAIPVVGDVFSFWFKSNTRNYRLLNKFLDSESGEEEPGGWWPLLVIVGTILLVFVLNVLSWIILGGLIWKLGSLLSPVPTG